jgi:hypothetical protein
LLTAAFALLLITVAAPASTKARQRPKLEHLSGVWIGGSAGSELEFARLQLDARGTGILTVSYLPDAPVRAYRVLRSRLDGFKVFFELSPGSDSEPIYLRGEFHFGYMNLQMGGVDRKWKREMYLRNEETFMKRLREVEQKAKEAPPGSER